MSLYELSISLDYVKDWTYIEAIRELFQNAIDEGEWCWKYENETLVISNSNQKLEKKSLLLGNGTKSTDNTKIGNFGEGYKLALLVLLREGYDVRIINHKELWKPKIIKSRRYNSDILGIEISNEYESNPYNGIKFYIKNLMPDKYEKIKDTNLFLQEKYNSIETNFGEILLDNTDRAVFVGGLRVMINSCCTYSYNFKPEYIQLDRDRRLISEFDLTRLTSDCWSDVFDKYQNKIIDMSKQGIKDVCYLANRVNSKEDIINYNEKFVVPVSNNTEMEFIKQNYSVDVIIAPDDYCSLIRKDISFAKILEKFKKTNVTPVYDMLIEFKEEYSWYLPELGIKQLDLIIDKFE